MACNITDIVVEKTVAEKIASIGLSVEVMRYDHDEVPMPTTTEGIKLVSFHPLTASFADFNITRENNERVDRLIKEHLKAQGIDAEDVRVELVYRCSKQLTDISSSPVYSRSEAVGFAYMNKSKYREKYPKIDHSSMDDFISIKINDAIDKLTDWQYNNNYVLTFISGGETLFKSEVRQKIADWDHAILYRAGKLSEEHALEMRDAYMKVSG